MLIQDGFSTEIVKSLLPELQGPVPISKLKNEFEEMNAGSWLMEWGALTGLPRDSMVKELVPSALVSLPPRRR